jgi:hypothetical protein
MKTVDENKNRLIAKLAKANQLILDDQTIKGNRAFGSALVSYYDAVQCKRMPTWLVDELFTYDISPERARRLMTDYRRVIGESQLAKAMKPGTEVEPVAEAEIVGSPGLSRRSIAGQTLLR